MAQVTDLASYRAARLERAAQAAILHPALRWAVQGGNGLAHRRRNRQHLTWCGTEGSLAIAPTGIPLCPACYGPPRPE